MIHGYCSAVVVKKKTNERKQLAQLVHNLLTNGGRDFYHNQCLILDAASNTKAANQIAVTEDTTQTLDATQTALTGEITTNGLARTNPSTTVNHTAGTNSSLIEHTYTASGAFTNVVRSAIFNATTTGTMTHIAAFATGSGTLASGDTLKTSWTVNIG